MDAGTVAEVVELFERRYGPIGPAWPAALERLDISPTVLMRAARFEATYPSLPSFIRRCKALDAEGTAGSIDDVRATLAAMAARRASM